MAFLDLIYGLVIITTIIIGVLIADYAYNTIMTPFNNLDNDPEIVNFNNNMTAKWHQNRDFFNNSFGAIFFIILVIDIVLIIFIRSHPVFLVIWFFMNLILLYVYDSMSVIVDAIEDSVINTGAMNNAISFFNGWIPKSLIIGNMITAMILFGKRVIE